MAETIKSLLERNISCGMDVISEFCKGVSELFMNAQDILSESKETLNTLTGITGSIPGEALHAGLVSSIQECLTKIEMCDMGVEAFAITRKANTYVDNMYSTDSRFAEMIKTHAGIYDELINTVKISHKEISQKFKISIKASDFLLLSEEGSTPSPNNDTEELQEKLNKMQYYNEAYNHVGDQRARDYFQRRMNQCFSNELRPILGQRIYDAIEKTDGTNHKEAIKAWYEVKEIIQVCKYAKTYQSLCQGLDTDVNIIIVAIENDNNKTILQEKENIKNINIQLNQLHELSDEYFQWLCVAESVELIPYRCEKDNDDAKRAKTVTLGIGFTFDIEGTHWYELKKVLGWTDEDIRNVINAVYNDEEIDEKYTITEEQARELFEETSDEYIENVNYNVEMYNSQNDEITFYSQNEFEAMFDYAYNNGLEEKSHGIQYRDNDEYIIYYYLRKDQENGVNAVIEQSEGKEEIGTKRRLNQMNLFFEKDYNYLDNNQLEELRERLGFYDN